MAEATYASRNRLASAPLRFLRTTPGGAWGVLMASTIISWWVGGHGTGALATTVVLAVAFFKVQIVGWNFLELREAPLALRFLFSSWCIGVCAVLIGIYLVTM